MRDIPTTEQELYEFFEEYAPQRRNNTPRGMKFQRANDIEADLRAYLASCFKEIDDEWAKKRKKLERTILSQKLDKLHSKGVNRFRLENR